ITLAAAPVSLMAADNPYKEDGSIVNLGSHNEPDLEAVVAVDPDLIINGQRFSQYRDDFVTLAPDAAIVELDPRDGEAFEGELKRQIEVLGTIFGRDDDASALIDDFDASVKAVKDAYDPSLTVMTVITAGGEINFSAPSTGRTLGPVYDMLGLTPALEADGSGDHTGDDISVEAIAASDPGLILVMDRDAAVSANSGEEYTPANELIADSEALQNVAAVKEGKIVYMPQYTYVNEGIQTYTTFFNQIAEAL
ncbi:MAG TPA: ABC transporter substrate-binding protein, partial [Candidatus Avipropionibacterium avicola]|nr:ABC transporter substrate-binding protein [Candidatus Avipropionibacterium avicola]